MRLQFYRIVTACALLVFVNLAGANEVLIEESGLSMTLPAAWTAKYDKAKIPTGQLMQRWSRTALPVGQFRAAPGLVIVATPVSKDANLSLISQTVLNQTPYNVKLAVDTECIKCVIYKVKVNGGVATAIAPDAPGKCVEYKPGVEAECIYQQENKINLNLERSWAHRFEKDAEFGKMFVLSIHAIVDEKFVDISFFYPKEVANQIQPEIAAIVSSIKKTPR